MANFQKVETLDCSILKLNKITREGANSLAHCFNTAGDTPSGSHDLLPARQESTIKTPDSVNNIFDKYMFLYSSIFGTADDTLVLLCEATSNYLLNMEAISSGLVALTPS